MKVRARRLLLFSFAFSSVLSSAEFVISSDTKTAHLRDTRPGDNSEKPTTKPIDHGLEKREVETYPGEESVRKALDAPILSSNFLEKDKRNRMGFTGMRGKKDQDPADNFDLCCKTNANPLDSALDKRGLRSYKELFGGKRAPLAFHGMRGKKSEAYDWTESEVANLRPSPAITRGFYDDANDLFGFEYADPFGKKEEETYEDDSINKRSPYSFQGMRGKKTIADDLKRAMGFLGMRGKKTPEIWQSDDYKRAPQTGFFGMKGKKAQSGFFGMRGKKPSLMPYDVQSELGGPPSYDVDGVNSLDEAKEGDSHKDRFRRGTNWLGNTQNTKNALFDNGEKKTTDEITADVDVQRRTKIRQTSNQQQLYARDTIAQQSVTEDEDLPPQLRTQSGSR